MRTCMLRISVIPTYPTIYKIVYLSKSSAESIFRACNIEIEQCEEYSYANDISATVYLLNGEPK